MFRKFCLLTFILLMCLCVNSQAAVVYFNAPADIPTPGPIDPNNLIGCSGVIGGSGVDANNVEGVEGAIYNNDFATYVAMDRGSQGQFFFTPDDEPVYQVTGFWLRHVLYDATSTWVNLASGGIWDMRVVDPVFAGTDLFVLHQETYTITQTEPNIFDPGDGGSNTAGTGAWVHVVFDEPVAVAPGTMYGFDMLNRTGGQAFWETDGRKDTAPEPNNLYPDANAFTTGAAGNFGNTYILNNGDMVFILELTDEPPLKASMPNPPDGAPDASLSPTLTWVPGLNAALHHVYFGDVEADVEAGTGGTDKGTQVAASYSPGTLIPETEYFWRIDEVNGGDTWEGDVWSFTVSATKASEPSPLDDEVAVFYDPCAVLNWDKGSESDQSKVYFGATSGSLSLETTIVHDGNDRYSYDKTGLSADTEYFWRVDEYNSVTDITWAGDEWSFTTIPDITPIPNLVGWWKFDEGPTKAIDWSGNGQHGTLYGNATTAPGYYDDGLLLDGNNDYAQLPIGDLIETLDSTTIACWVNWEDDGQYWERIFDFGINTDINMFLTPRGGAGVMRLAITTGGAAGESQLDGNQVLPEGWHHVAIVIDAAFNETYMYLDGAEAGYSQTAILPSDMGNTDENYLGESQYGADPEFEGMIDDFRIYNVAFSETQIQELAKSPKVSSPNPPDNAISVYRYPVLSWEPGIFVADTDGHQLYFSSDFNDVNTRNPAVKITLTDPTYTIPTPPAPLESLAEYFWAVDEVNNGHPDVNWPGDIWSFTIRDEALIDDFEGYTTSDLDPTDGNDLRMTWIDGEWDFEEPTPQNPDGVPGSSGGFVQLATDENDAWDQDFGGAYEHYQPADTVRNGSDSMKFHFDNDGEVRWIYDLYYGYQNTNYIYDAPQYSEARAAVVDAGIIDAGEGQQSLKMLNDWSGYKVMRVSYYGDANNADMESSDKLFVTLADDAVSDVNPQVQYNADVDSLNEEWWHDWYIAMSEFTDDNPSLNMGNIYRVHVGVGNRVSPSSGGTGLIFIDDLQLYSTGICESGTVAEDFTGDCEVDNADLGMMNGIWLNDVTTTPVIKIDASILANGPKTSIANQGSYSCNFVDFNDANTNDSPIVETVDSVQCITFDINDVLISDANAPDSITGSGPFTAVFKIYNPEYDEHNVGDEEFFMWAKRGTENRYAAICLGSNTAYGAGAFWGAGDIGYNQLPAAGEWHEVVMIYEGRSDGTLYVWVDGHLDNSDAKSLDIWPDCPMLLGGAYDGDPYVVEIPDGLTVNPDYKFTGSLAYLAIYDYAVPVWELEDWAIGDAIPANPINLYDSDSVIDFKDLALMGLKWMETPTLFGE